MENGSKEVDTKNPQEELEELWKRPEGWQEGPQIKIKGLPEGIRLIMPSTDYCVLRAKMWGTPAIRGEQEIDDIPIGIYGENFNPEEVLEEAKKWMKLIIKGEVKYIPNEGK